MAGPPSTPIKSPRFPAPNTGPLAALRQTVDPKKVIAFSKPSLLSPKAANAATVFSPAPPRTVKAPPLTKTLSEEDRVKLLREGWTFDGESTSFSRFSSAWKLIGLVYRHYHRQSRLTPEQAERLLLLAARLRTRSFPPSRSSCSSSLRLPDLR
jgi:hypothetical protein